VSDFWRGVARIGGFCPELLTGHLVAGWQSITNLDHTAISLDSIKHLDVLHMEDLVVEDSI
jgi:hypothetical protein